MAYRFTNTDKWNDSWFSGLSPLEKLLFIYLCDNCDIAGFIEVNIKRWSADIDATKPQIEGALKGLARGLTYSNTGDCIFLNNFLKHQKNLPINQKNQAHKGIITRFENYSHKFSFEDYNEFLEGAKKGLRRGSGNGNGNECIYIEEENFKEKKEKEKNWKNDFEIYKDELRVVFKRLMQDEEFIAKQERLNPGIDIRLTMEKACVNYWAKEAGWKHKKSENPKNIDWEQTLINSLSNTQNRVWKPKITGLNERRNLFE